MVRLIRFIAWTLALLVLTRFVSVARADRSEKTLDLGGGKKLTYQIVTPDGFKPGSVAPVLLMFPPGDQAMNMVNLGLDYFDPQCRARGWVVVSPQASKGELFYRGGEAHIPALLAELKKSVSFEGQRVHVAGMSNGGISAFRFAVLNPQMVASLVVFPGYATKEDLPQLKKLAGIPVRMWVGFDDLVEWKDAAKETAEAAKNAGLDVQFEIRQAQSHVIQDLDADFLLNMFDSFRKPGESLKGGAAEVAMALDDFHDAAAKADFARYFGRFDPAGIFIGTDATERWTVPEFKAYAKPYFDKGKGWVYHPRDRHVDLASDGQMAWFDELLDHDKYGTCRGSGVLRKVGDQWLVLQYHLTVPVPNDLMERVVKLIKADEGKKKPKDK